ncbi:porin [Microtetraspora sp. NBRC 13810]|uniref:MIP/aquaporin family protein n=1 Tax=Microtetraspora sp. NBRC 13810 TaxID=3030990 RepID=UPI0025539F5E|nr:MIP/aquaporin family protein [Microtetraspora sp. NBRC 13810]GLW10233.1 porin [Microtetraspora sp. NBRC 13810]
MVGRLPRRLLAEVIGTALLIVFGAGSVVAALVMGNGRLDYAALGFISLAFGLIVTLVVYTFGNTSGAHINPAVTIALAVGRRFPWRDVPAYVAAQLFGSFAGGVLVVAIFGPMRAVGVGKVGLTSLGPGIGYGQGILAEALATFLLLLTIMALAVDRRAPPGWAGFVIGLAVACEIFVLGPLTGGSVNPARTFGPYLTTSVFGGDAPWSLYGVYVAGPVAGAVLAVLVYDQVVRPAREGPETAQGTAGEITGTGEPGEPRGSAEVPEAREAPDHAERRPGRTRGRGR